MRTLIIPGLNGSDVGHWQWHWQQDIPGSSIVHQVDWARPDLDCWVATIEHELERGGDAFIVAHSLGCLVAAKLAARHSAHRIKGALLVAPCDPDLTNSFHPGAISYGRLNEGRLPFPNVLVGSLNDHYMPIDKLTDIGERWRANVLNLGMAGHINIASGYGRWVKGYGLMDMLTNRSKAEKRKSASAKTYEVVVHRC